MQRSITLTANVKIPPMSRHRDPATGADALRRCAKGLVNDRPCEQLAAQVGEAVVALLVGATGILGVEVTLTHPNGDAVEWAAEAYLGIEIED